MIWMVDFFLFYTRANVQYLYLTVLLFTLNIIYIYTYIFIIISSSSSSFTSSFTSFSSSFFLSFFFLSFFFLSFLQYRVCCNQLASWPHCNFYPVAGFSGQAIDSNWVAKWVTIINPPKIKRCIKITTNDEVRMKIIIINLSLPV